MDQQIQWLIEGAPIGCVYGLVAVGLVLTYKTSGVFNLAFGAQAFLSGWVFYDLVDNGWPLWLSFIVAVVIVGPLVGLVLDRALFRYMRTASWQVKLVTALGLLLALPEVVRAFYGQAAADNPPSIAPLIGINRNKVFHVLDYVVSADRMTTTIVTVAAVILLGLLFRYTAIGLQMRAVVESPRMVELAGVDSDRVSLVSWMLSSLFAGLAGVLLAPLFFVLDGNIYTLLIIAAIAAAAVGRFASIPWTLVGGLIMGVAARALPDVIGASSSLAVDLRPSFPFLLLFLLLILWPRFRERREVTDPLAGVDPPPPAMAHEYKNEALQRASRVGFSIFMAGFIAVMLVLTSSNWLSQRITFAFCLAIIFLSVTIFTGLGGQISLAQSSFAAAGGFTVANASSELHIPVLAGVVLGGIVAAIAGAIFVLLIDGVPALIGRARGRPMVRLSGLYLSVATLAAALMAEQVIFRRDEISHGQFGVSVPKPEFAHSDATWFLVVFGVFAVVGYAVILIRKGTIGRYFAALRGSETAAASIGINATALRITLFALAAGVAGIGGGLLAIQETTITANDPNFSALFGVLYVVLVVTLGSRTVDGAANAAIGLIVFNWLLVDALSLPIGLVVMSFGFGAITYARHPEGIVEYQTRKSILATQRQQALKARADEMAKTAPLPPQYRPTWQAWAPILAGPALYFVYILVRTFAQGVTAHFQSIHLNIGLHWTTVHSTTLLVFILPSLAYALVWIFGTDALLRRAGGYAQGPLLLLAGGAAGGLGGLLFAEQQWVARGGIADCVLVGIPAGIASVAFVLLPVDVARIAKQRGWLSTPISWRDGRAPLFFVLAGAFLFFRTSVTDTSTTGIFVDKGFPPGGWPVFFITTIFVIVWVQWVGAVQAACNELAIGGEGFQPPEEKVTVPKREERVPAAAGGGT